MYHLMPVLFNIWTETKNIQIFQIFVSVTNFFIGCEQIGNSLPIRSHLLQFSLHMRSIVTPGHKNDTNLFD